MVALWEMHFKKYHVALSDTSLMAVVIPDL